MQTPSRRRPPLPLSRRDDPSPRYGPSRWCEKGTALPTVLLLAFLILMLGLTLMGTAELEMKLGVDHAAHVEALYIAEAGVHRSLHELNQDSDWRGEDEGPAFPEGDNEIGRGKYLVTVTGPEEDPTLEEIAPYTVRITSKAVGHGPSSRALIVLAEAEPSLIHPLVRALASDEAVIRDELTTRLPALDDRAVCYAVLDALEAEAAVREPRVPYLSRLFVVLQRTTRRDPGYYPTMSSEEVRLLVANIRKTLPQYLRTTAAREPRR